jgi:hypothetical protein
MSTIEMWRSKRKLKSADCILWSSISHILIIASPFYLRARTLGTMRHVSPFVHGLGFSPHFPLSRPLPSAQYKDTGRRKILFCMPGPRQPSGAKSNCINKVVKETKGKPSLFKPSEKKHLQNTLRQLYCEITLIYNTLCIVLFAPSERIKRKSCPSILMLRTEITEGFRLNVTRSMHARTHARRWDTNMPT